MRERIISRMVLVLLVIGLFVPIHDVCPVWATGTVYIRADGSIEPPTAPISTSDKITYTFTSNTSDMLVVERDNIVVEGAGQTIKGASAIPGSGEGITLEQRRNVVVRNIQVESFACGIWIDRSSNITVTVNNITACHWGISLEGIYPYENGSVNNKIIRNNITYIPYDGIGITLDRCLNNTISQNDVSPVFRFDSGRGISLRESANNSVSQNSIRSNLEGIYVVGSGLNNITDNSLWDNMFGILLQGSQFNSLVGNDVAMGIWHDSESGEPILMGHGITIRFPYDSNMLRNNNITGHKYNFGVEGYPYSYQEYFQDVDSSNTVDGKPIYYWVNKKGGQIPLDAGYVAIVNSTGVKVEGLELKDNYHGILLVDCTDITVEANNILDNLVGISLLSSMNNTIRENNLTRNHNEGIVLYTQYDHCSQVAIEGNFLTDCGISIEDCENSTIVNNFLTGAGIDCGISIEDCENSTIVNNFLTGAGIDLTFFNNGVVNNNSISDSSDSGILLGWYDNDCYNNTISGNRVTNCESYGILVEGSGNILRNNNLTGNAFNLQALLEYGLNDIDTSNTADRKPVYFLIDQHDLLISPSTFPSVGYLALLNSSNITVRDITVTHSGCGLQIWSTTDFTFENLNLTDNCYDLRISSANNCTIRNSTGGIELSNSNGIAINKHSGYLYASNSNYTVVSESSLGTVHIESSLDCAIDNCAIADGLRLTACNDTSVSNSEITAAENDFTLLLLYCNNNTITCNDMRDSRLLTICFDTSSNITLYHNNFVIGTSTFWEGASSMINWDNGCEGNFWNLYAGQDANRDGVGDTPHSIDQNNVDNYPLMNVYWSASDINHDLKVDMRDIGISAKAFGTGPGDQLWNPHADITGQEPLIPDGKADMRDISLVARHFGEHYS